MKQHYIPRVYLKQFESGRKKLYSLHNKAHKFSPYVKEQDKAQIGYLPDFYTIKSKNILNRLELSDKDIIEKVFNARVENRFEKILASLLSPSQTLSMQDAEEVLVMVLSMKERNPMFRRVFENPQTIIEAFNRRFEEVFEHRDIIERILKQEGRMSFDEFIKYGHNYAHQFAHDHNTPQDLHTEGIVKLYRNEKTIAKDIIRWLIGCEWYIFETTPQRPFITSDNPGFCIDNNERVHNLNFADYSGFYFPLTPKYFLLITAHFTDLGGSEKQIYHRRASPDLVELINRATFVVSYKKVLSNDENSLRHIWRDMCRFMPHLNDIPDYKSNHKRDNHPD